MNKRDDFSPKTRRAVATRAGWHCSLCRKLTVGPSEEGPTAITTIGIAAHIAAAAGGTGARRYDPSMTPEQRSGVGNAIWLCADHATLIDRDEVTYSSEKLHALKREHEAAVARAVRTGSQADLATGLLAIGPDIICTGEMIHAAMGSWTLRLGHFLSGDMHGLVAFIDGFASAAPESRYVLANELGDGRLLREAPSLTKQAEGYDLLCPIAPRAPRIDAQKLGSYMALHDDTNDLFLDAKGGIARIAGLDSLPQKIRTLLSMQRGESAFSPAFGVRFFEYYEAYRGSPWLDLLLKLDVVRQASIPFHDATMRQSHTPLRCVTRVHSVELLADIHAENRLPLRLDLDVQGVGRWQKDVSIYMPTAAEMAERTRMLAKMAWLHEAMAQGKDAT